MKLAIRVRSCDQIRPFERISLSQCDKRVTKMDRTKKKLVSI